MFSVIQELKFRIMPQKIVVINASTMERNVVQLKHAQTNRLGVSNIKIRKQVQHRVQRVMLVEMNVVKPRSLLAV
jgi:hypothetical protein